MSDIWSVGDSSGGSVDKLHASEDWDCGSDSSEGDQPPRKRAKKGNSLKPRPRRVIPTLDSSEPKAEDVGGEEDDLLAYLTTTATTPPAQRGKKGSKAKKDYMVVLLDDDDLGLEDTIASAGGGGGSKVVNGSSPDPVRLAALKQRALREKLAQAQHAAEENDDDEIQLFDSEDDGDLPLPAAGSLVLGAADDDPALQLLEELETGAAGTAAAGGGDDGKLPLVFQAQAHDSVTVRVQANQPLSHAMETFTKYAADNGWGRVTKFMFDGERLTGGDTPEDLQMDADDVIDVYMDS